MTTFRTDTPQRFTLPPGNVLSIDATAGNGRTGQMPADNPGGSPNTLKAVAAGTTLRVGPFPTTTYHYVDVIAGTLAITESVGSPPLPISGAPTDVLEMFGTTAPVDYTDGDPVATGENVAGKGSRYTDITAGAVYLNRGTKAAPAWRSLPTLTGTMGDVAFYVGAGAPVDYTDGSPPATGEGVAGIGSQYTDTTAGKLYLNGGTKAEPLWKIVTSA